MRYFIWFGYDGTEYHGWQVQPNATTVQGEIERALALLLQRDVAVTGAGRTDTGVHARQMAAHFDIDQLPMAEEELAKRMNGVLHRDIAIDRIERVADDMHARFFARARTYHYYIHTRKDAFLDRYSLEMHYRLDFALMNDAARLLMDYDDFGAFCKAGSDVKTTLCKVMAAEWHQTSDHTWYFEITANRFLRNMVRAVVGTLIEVGRGRMTLEAFRAVVEGRQRTQAGESMPAKALFLEKVTY